ncbi:MAG: NAD(P)/FAD-dependent oxidoreductase, partial [Planctomycetaceae bacterium]
MTKSGTNQVRLSDECDWQVIVIGAGVAGALAALHCVRAGFATLLVEKQKFPRHKVCGCCLNAKAWRALESAGVASELSKSSNPIQTTRFHIRGSQATVRVSGMQAVSRSELDSQLVSAFVGAGGSFKDGVTATVLPNTNRAQVRLQGWNDANRTECGSGDLSADVVLACDGLGHPSLRMFAEVESHVSKSSRVGVGAVIPRAASDVSYPTNELQMAVAKHGYVGTVQVEGHHLSVAAALDASVLKTGSSPVDALREIYVQNDLSPPANLDAAAVKGTLPLTRATLPVAIDRVFLLGDATGYVEPFTGEGMAWAMASAELIVPLVHEVIRNGWNPELPSKWEKLLRRDVRQRQRICRVLSRSLRYPWLLSPMLNAFRLFP